MVEESTIDFGNMEFIGVGGTSLTEEQLIIKHEREVNLIYGVWILLSGIAFTGLILLP